MRPFAAVLIVLVAASCGPAPIACGEPTALTEHPTQRSLSGAALGPLLVRGAFVDGATSAVISGYVAGTPTKVLLLVARDMDGDMALTGRRCRDGAPLRFWYGRGALPYSALRTAPPGELERVGELRERVPATAVSGGATAIGGYMLFPSVGSYEVVAWSGETRVGSVVISVSDAAYPPARPSAAACPVTPSIRYAGPDGVTRIAKRGGGMTLLTLSDGPFPSGVPLKFPLILDHRRPNERYDLAVTGREIGGRGRRVVFDVSSMLGGLAADGHAYSGNFTFPDPGCWEVVVDDSLDRGVVVLEVVVGR